MDFVKIFKENFKVLYEDMKKTEHGFQGVKNNPYHLEGDVWTHTKMVVEKTKEFKDELSEVEYKLLVISALFHDSGKPYVWKEINHKKKRYFQGHWNRSFYIVLDMLNGNPFGLTDIQVGIVAKLVLNHHRRYESEYSNIWGRGMTDLLSKLSYCDSTGRIYEAKDENENIEPLKYDEQKFVKRAKNKPTIEFLIGPPCVGKSTFIKKCLEWRVYKKFLSRDEIVLELAGTDDYTEAWAKVDQDEVNNILNKRYNGFIKAGISFTIDMTNMSKKGRKKFMNKNFNSKAVIFLTGYEEIMRRNKERENKTIPEDVINDFINKFSFGFYDEFSEVNYVYG